MSRKKNRSGKPQKIVSEYTGMPRELKIWWKQHLEMRAAQLQNALADVCRLIDRLEDGPLKQQWEAQGKDIGDWLDRCEAEIADLYCELEGGAL